MEDHKRTGAYYQAIMSNRRQFKGKVVLDVGTGSGILSIFAAKAGAKKVYAVEATSMAEDARRLIAHNKVRRAGSSRARLRCCLCGLPSAPAARDLPPCRHAHRCCLLPAACRAAAGPRDRRHPGHHRDRGAARQGAAGAGACALPALCV